MGCYQNRLQGKAHFVLEKFPEYCIDEFNLNLQLGLNCMQLLLVSLGSLMSEALKPGRG